MSDHDKYGIKLKLSTVGAYLCVVLVVLVVAMATVAKNLHFDLFQRTVPQSQNILII